MIPSILLLVEAAERVRGSADEEFSRMDPNGIALAVIAMTIVFTSLLFLYITFKYVAKLYNIDFKKIFKRKQTENIVEKIPEYIPEETLAAISLALFLYHQQMQGLEDAVITFKNAAKTYSPWSSKIYGLRRSPNH